MAEQSKARGVQRDDEHDAGQVAAGPLAGEPRRRGEGVPPLSAAQRAVTWLAWWALMMSLWVAVDDSLMFDELLAGAGAAALAALAAEAVSHQAATRYRIRAAWLSGVLRLPGALVLDTGAVFGLLARTLLARVPPPHGAFRAIPVGHGGDSPLDVTRRTLLTWAKSFTPNAFVVGIDAERDVMVVHELVRR